MRHVLFFMLILCSSAQAEPSRLGWLERVDYLHAEDRHMTSQVWSGHFRALNGDNHDMAHFYAPQRPQLNIRTAFTISKSSRLRFAVPMHYDHGYRAALYQATPYFGIGFIGQWAVRDNLVLGFHMHDGLQSGGDIIERPCHDDLERAFHCGSGLPWSDAQTLLQDRQIYPSGKITLHLRF